MEPNINNFIDWLHYFTGEEGTGMKVVKRDCDRQLAAPASTIAEEAVDQLQASEKLIAGE